MKSKISDMNRDSLDRKRYDGSKGSPNSKRFDKLIISSAPQQVEENSETLAYTSMCSDMTFISGVVNQMVYQSDCIICIERCNDCKNHITKDSSHNQSEYKLLSNRYLKYCAEIIHSLNVSARVGVIDIPISLSSKDRIGAFEITLSIKTPLEVITKILHSKLETSLWPSKGLLRFRLKRLFNELRISCFDSTVINKFQSYQSWEATKLSNRDWKFSNSLSNSKNGSLTPSPPKAERPSLKRQINFRETDFPVTVEWVFDFRNIKVMMTLILRTIC